MASDDNSHSPPINGSETDTSPIVKHTKSDTPVPPLATIVPMTSDLTPCASYVRSAKKNLLAKNCSEYHYASAHRKSTTNAFSINLRHRLCVREFFVARLTLVSNAMSFLAILGIVLMIIENELTFGRVDDKDTKASWFIKLIITITTVILLILILYYHQLDMTLYAFRNVLEDWRVELTITKILLIALELVVCAIHPVLRSYSYTDPERIDSDSSSVDPYSLSHTAVDVGLGLPMFLRLYLIGRSILLHSHLIRDITLRSFGYWNHVPIGCYFLTKSYLEHWPTRCLATFCILFFFIGSWSLRACDYAITSEHMSMSNAMWLFIITSTTVGYGDQYPSTYCGRSVAAIISLVGLLLTALLIAILTKKLVLTREEKYVHTFVLNTRLSKNRKNQAANTIKFAMKAWYLRRKNKSTSIQYFQVQRKLFRSIQCFQHIREDQQSLVDSCVGFTELMITERNTSMQTEKAVKQTAALKSEVKEIKEELHNLNCSMNNLQNTLNNLLNQVTK